MWGQYCWRQQMEAKCNKNPIMLYSCFQPEGIPYYSVHTAVYSLQKKIGACPSGQRQMEDEKWSVFLGSGEGMAPELAQGTFCLHMPFRSTHGENTNLLKARDGWGSKKFMARLPSFLWRDCGRRSWQRCLQEGRISGVLAVTGNVTGTHTILHLKTREV